MNDVGGGKGGCKDGKEAKLDSKDGNKDSSQ